MIDISIVVPMYNVENYIEKCLESLLKQATDIAYEIILVDDGSSDNTVRICKKYKNKYKNISILSKKKWWGIISKKHRHREFKRKICCICR